MPSLGSLARTSIVLVLLVAPMAHAADRASPDRLKDLETEATALQAHSEEIKRNFTERSGLIGVNEARQRYEDAVYLFLVHDYEAAATSFYILVQSRALGNADLARDSEWYLAECLFELGNYRTAEEAYRSIIEKGPQHPFFPDAIRRILEVYGILGDTAQFDKYYNDFIVTGRVPPTELINYTLAKSFYRRGESSRSKAMFESLPATSPYYTRARYFLGVLMIREKNYAQAIAEYKRIQDITPTDPDQQQVLELSQLALARLYYETGDFTQAGVWYAKLGSSSPHYADQLYESVWTYIKQANAVVMPTPPADKTPAAMAEYTKQRDAARDAAHEKWAQALSQVDIFLLAFPEHKYTASLKLLQGHLNMKLESYEDARTSYERVVDEYTPLVDRLGAVNGPDQLRRLLEGVSGGEAGLSEKLPPFAVGMLLGQEDVARAADAYRAIARERDELAESERIVKDLEVALSGGDDVLGAFVSARQEVSGIRGSALSLRDRLLDTEATWLKTRVPAQYRPEIAQLQKDRASVLASVTAIDQSAGVSTEREQLYDEQVREVQQRAFRLSQVAQEARATASSTMDQVGQSKLPADKAEQVRSDIVRAQKDLDAELADLDSLQSEVVRKKVMRTVASGAVTGDDARRQAILAKYDDIRRRLGSYRGYVTDPEAANVFAQTDRVWGVVEGLDQSTDATSGVLVSAEGREMSAVRTRLARESQRVIELRRDIDKDSADAETVAMKAVRTGIYTVEDQFKADVLEADKGIVDVYWLRKTAATDEMTALGVEQTRLLHELDDQFRIVRENLDR